MKPSPDLRFTLGAHLNKRFFRASRRIPDATHYHDPPMTLGFSNPQLSPGANLDCAILLTIMIALRTREAI